MHRENSILVNCHLHKSTLYPLYDLGARLKRVFNLVYYSLLILWTFVVLEKTANATSNISFYCFIEHNLSRHEGVSLLAVDHKPADIFPSFYHITFHRSLCKDFSCFPLAF